MASLQKQPVNINFGRGVDTKTDKYQVPIGTFLTLVNSVFTTTNQLTKRNGFANITTLPNTNQTTLTTLNNNLLATGSNLYAYSPDTSQWLKQGIVQPVQLSVQPLVRVSTSQSSPDAVVAPNGTTCLVYVDNSIAYYQVSDSSTGQQIVARTSLGSTATNPRVVVFGQYFIITFMATVSAATHLRYVAVPWLTPSQPLPAADLATTVLSLGTGYDIYSTPAGVYYAWSRSGTVIDIAILTLSNIALATTPTATPITGSHTATLMSVTVDPTGNVGAPVIWVSWFDGTNVWTTALSTAFVSILVPTETATSVSIVEITSVAQNKVLSMFYETSHVYGISGVLPDINTTRTDFVSATTVTQAAGTIVGPTVILRSVGLASKAFIASSGTIYMMVAYGEANQDLASPGPDQNTYFLIDSTGAIYERLAYSNGGGYAASQVLPTVSLNNGSYYFPYLIADFLSVVNKTTDAAIPINAIYTQTGVNLAQFTLNAFGQYSSEIAGALHLTGGQLWEYDGVRPVEHGFHVWPDNVGGTTTASGGSIGTGTYYYQFTYEWTDNAGNLQRSAPSVPIVVTVAAGSSTNTLYVPMLRLTYKVSPNKVRIVGYRWSVAQQVYYQFTSITSPVVNDPTTDIATIVDTSSDAQILGQTILYVTGGVIENIAAPASIHSALFNNRLWLIDAEDPNLLWFSKQVIENTPVEMSDLLTLYVAPTSGAQGSTGPCTALSAMDDKLIIFKKDAIYYVNGTGPDNTGNNNNYSDPIFVTSSVGCTNPASIVLMPNGLMFQSDKGIWLLGRDLSTNYIGAPVEAYNSYTIQSAQAIPGTNQVRFILATQPSITLMYDYYFNQWGTFSNMSAISATLFDGQHTYLNSFGQVFQETPGTYTDGSNPVLMSFTTSWINVAGLQGFERFYSANLLGTYYTPFVLNAGIAYNYNPSFVQNTPITPDNYGGVWGSQANWGSGGAYGSGGNSANVFTTRLFPDFQKCSSFQLSINEQYDNRLGAAPGQGLSLSGILMMVGIKRGSRTQSASKSFGS